MSVTGPARNRKASKPVADLKWAFEDDPDLIRARSFDLTSLRFATSFRLLKIREAFLSGKTIQEVYETTKIDMWFLHQIKMLCNQKYDASLFYLQ